MSLTQKLKQRTTQVLGGLTFFTLSLGLSQSVSAQPYEAVVANYSFNTRSQSNDDLIRFARDNWDVDLTDGSCTLYDIQGTIRIDYKTENGATNYSVDGNKYIERNGNTVVRELYGISFREGINFASHQPDALQMREGRVHQHREIKARVHTYLHIKGYGDIWFPNNSKTIEEAYFLFGCPIK